MATMQERLRQHKRRRRLRILGRLVAIVLVGYALHYGWVYIHQPGLAIGSITIHGSNLLSEKEAIELGGSTPPFNFFNVSQRRLKEALKHDIRFQNARVDYHCPAPLGDEVTAHVQGLALAAYKVLGLSGVARIDVMLDEHNQGYVLEANTVPGMTATSLVPKAAAAVGIAFPDLCERILLSAK